MLQPLTLLIPQVDQITGREYPWNDLYNVIVSCLCVSNGCGSMLVGVLQIFALIILSICSNVCLCSLLYYLNLDSLQLL